jgi:hypothetical protein
MRPCTCDRVRFRQSYTVDQCRLCWLYHHDAAYHRLWGGEGQVPAMAQPSSSPTRGLPCIYLGDIVDKLGCACPGRWVRKCDVHQTCTLQQCKSCPDYEVS